MSNLVNVQKNGRIFGIKNKITLAFVLFLIIPIIIISIISLANINILGGQVATLSGGALDSEETRSIGEIMTAKTNYMDEVFKKSASDIDALAKYAADLFEGRIEQTGRASYYHNVTTVGNSPPDLAYDEIYDRTISYDYSCYVFPYSNLEGKSSYLEQNATVNETISISAGLDSQFAMLKAATPEYKWIYMGFQIGMHRSYPWHSYGSDYDPRLRPWYGEALVNEDNITFTDPYLDSTTGDLVISITKPVKYDNGTLIGVVAADLMIETMKTTILNTKVLDSGYAFLLNGENTVAHPNLDDVDVPITTLESTSYDFQQLLNQMSSSSSGTGIYTKSESQYQTWQLSYQKLESTGYTLVITVPEDEITLPATQIENDISSLISTQIGLFIVILIGVTVVIAFMSNYVSKKIVKPITGLTKMMNFISQGDISREIPFGTEKNPDEISYLTNSFKNLITLLRLGNEDYYRGDLDKAAKNYQQALQVFKLSDNLKGMGVCYNNLGNIYRIQSDYENAQKSYQKAINIANQLQDTESVAKRMNNLAQLYADSKRETEALSLFDETYQIHQNLQNPEGQAQVLRNKGLLQANMGDVVVGKDNIERALQIDEELNKSLNIAYDKLYLGKIALMNNDSELALSLLEECKKKAEYSNDNRLLLNAYKELEKLYLSKRDNMKAHRARAAYEKIRISLMQKKFVVLVIDVSGSMRGPRMRAAVQGALDIFENQVNPQDQVAIILFQSISELILPPTQKAGNETRISQIIREIRASPYQTSFYDAVGDSFAMLNEAIGNEQKWIIALTDGLDNTSQKFSIYDRKYTGFLNFLNQDKRVGLGEFIEDNLLNFNLIVIGIGDELRSIEDQLVKLTTEQTQGQYIPVHNLRYVEKAISDAFREVADLLAQINVEDFTAEEE